MKAVITGVLCLALTGCGANTIQDLDETRSPQTMTLRGRTITATGNEADGPSDRAHPVDAAGETVWGTLPYIFSQLELEPNRADRTNRILGVEEQRVSRIAGQRPSEFLECGQSVGGRLANTQELTMTLLTQVADAGAESSLLRVVFNGYVRNRNHGGGITQCRTTGALEDLIAEMATQAIQTR